ncbi:hypothetical protein MPSEU_000468200 [Mayamaea pseudoterrestris]|nr:hypothetical protein MPSEU_000468200 [Mayamaea pseudoterrestris]
MPYTLEDDRPVRDMMQTWLLYIMLPAGLIAWGATHRPAAVVAATLATPCLAIVQGAIGILSFRLNFGDAPLPCTPSHGVVIVRPDENNENMYQHEERTNSEHHNNSQFIKRALQQRPVRLLVIGDSLAIGVGQSKSSTPIMPEVIAKTLSKKLNGRVVYWTCHGAPGASTGWVVRELERGINYRVYEDAKSHDDDDENRCDAFNEDVDSFPNLNPTTEAKDNSTTSDVSSTNDGASTSDSEIVASSKDLKQWKDRLYQHSRRFYDPHRLGPYDVVVILTGSNDLKSAFFPFLLTGEDAEFRRQAKLRGGSYGLELRRLLETLEQKMTMRIKTFKETVIHSVEAATDKLQDSIEETMERLAPGSSQRLNSFRLPKGDSKKTNEPNTLGKLCNDINGTIQPSFDESPIKSDETRPFPVIVLPGMPSRTLPIFRQAPLRWLAVPIVDIMDSHKRRLANSKPGDLLFVKAPSVKDLADYETGKGVVWQERVAEQTLLSLSDVQKQVRCRIEKEMHLYFEKRGVSAANAIAKAPATIWRRFLPCRAIPAGFEVFAVDQIHPNEKGYDFWGRHIANAVVDELHRKGKDG